MTITFPRDLPDIAIIGQPRFQLIENTVPWRSPINNVPQTQVNPGGLWKGLFQFLPVSGAEAAELKAWLISLEGEANTFKAYDPQARTPFGIADTGSDTPLVDGGGQSGATLNTKGWRNNGVNLLLPGDYFQVGNTGTSIQLKMVTEAVSSDGTGLAVIPFRSPLHKSPAADAPVIFDNPVGVFTLDDSQQAGWDIRLPSLMEHAIAFTEFPEV